MTEQIPPCILQNKMIYYLFGQKHWNLKLNLKFKMVLLSFLNGPLHWPQFMGGMAGLAVGCIKVKTYFKT